MTKRFFALTLLTLLLVAAPIAGAFTHYRMTDGASAKWVKARAAAIQYYLNTAGTADIAGAGEFDAIETALRDWSSVTSSYAAFDVPVQRRLTALGFNPGDGFSVIAFAGGIADPDVPANALSFTTLVVQQTGQQPVIVEADTVFNDQYFWTPDTTNLQTTPPQRSLYASALREGGAMLGLGNSLLRVPLLDLNQLFTQPLVAAQLTTAPIMFPFNFFPQQAPISGVDTLQHDDEVAMSELYPSVDYFEQVGIIKGRVFDSASGQPVFPVQVTAFNANTRQPVVSEINSRDGSFQVRGLPAGPYFLLFEPAPTALLTAPYFNATQVTFIPTFYLGVLRAPINGIIQVPANSEMKIIQVEAGKTTGGAEQPVILGFDGNDSFEPNDELTLSPEVTPTANPEQGPIGVIQDVNNSIRDIDVYRFFAEQGDLVRIRVRAGELGSPLDARVRLYSGASLEAYAEQNPDQPDPGRMFRDVAPLVEEDNDPETAALDPDVTYRVQAGGAFVVVVDRSPLQPVPSRTDPRVDYYQLVIEVLSGVVPIPPESEPFAVLSLNLSAQELALNPSNAQLLEITFSIRDFNNDGDITYDPGNPLAANDFKDPITSQADITQSGVALYRNDGAEVGRFDFDTNNPAGSDKPVSLSQIRVVEQSGEEIRVTLVVSGQEIIPPEADNKVDYWIVLRTTLNLAQGDDFTVSIPAGGIKVRDFVSGQPHNQSLFAGVYPTSEKQNIYSGDIVRFTMPLQQNSEGTRISARSVPTSVLGVNVKGAAAEEYWIHQVDVVMIGANALWFLRAFDYFPVLDANDHIPVGVPPSLKVGEDTFRIGDLDFLTVNGTGGIAIYRDNDTLDAQGDPVGRDGVFEEDVDVPIELESIEIHKLGRSEIPRQAVAALVPDTMKFLANFGATLDQVDAEAYLLTLTLKREGQQDKLRVPDTDLTANNTGGADFHVVVRTSGKISALDTFLPTVRVGGVRVANGLGVAPVPGEDVISVPSLSRLDYSSVPQTRPLICRPKPEITVTDLTTETSVLASAGEDTRLPIFGINGNDRGQNAERIFATEDGTIDRYFNQSYVFDAYRTIITQVLPGQPAREVYPASGTLQDIVSTLQYLDANPSIPFGGVCLYMDDDTPIGDGRDNDGDFLIDEELNNNIDDDMDGLIDEDVGDGDPAGLNGMWDSLDDVHPGGRFFNSNYTINPIIPEDAAGHGEVRYARGRLYPQPHGSGGYRLRSPITIDNINNALFLRMPMLMNVVNEGSIGGFHEFQGVMRDPFTTNPDFPFVRTDYHPIWNGQTSTLADAGPVVTINEPAPGDVTPRPNPAPDIIEPVGFYIFLEQDNWPVHFDYDTVTEVLDDDLGYNAGNDYFIVASASPSATPEVQLRFEFPAGGFEYSVYQSRFVNLNGAFPGTGGNRVKTGSIRIVGEQIMPTLRIIQPGAGANIATKDQAFTVTWQASDPDSIAEIKLYLDTDSIAGNGLIPGSTVTRIELTPSPLREGINPEFFIMNLAQVVNDPRYRHLNFSLADPNLRFYVVAEIYDRVVNGVADPERLVTVYSNGYVTPFRTSVAGLVADYVKLHRNGTLSSFGEAPILFSFQQTANTAVDFEMTQSGGGAIGLLHDGQLRASGNVEGLNGAVFGQGLVDLTRLEGGQRQIADAVDMEVDFGRGGLVLLGSSGELAAYGSLFPEAYVAELSTQAQQAVGAAAGVTAVDVELQPGFTGGYVLLSNGQVLHAGAGSTGVGGQAGGSAPAVDLTLLPAGNGYYILYADGTVSAAGDASTDLAGQAAKLNRSDAKDLEVTFSPEGPGLLILRGTGQVMGIGSVEVGFDATLSENSDHFTALEVFGSAGQDKQAVKDILDALYNAYTREDVGSFMAQVAEDYVDDSGNDREKLRKCLTQIFDTYELRPNLAQRSMITQTTDENPKVDVIGNVASATAVTSDAYKIPELAFIDVSEDADINTVNLTYRFPLTAANQNLIPFDQTATLIELSDGRGWFLEVYDIEGIGRVDLGQDFGGLDNLGGTGGAGQSTADFDYITQHNVIVNRWFFERSGTEGPRRLTLLYDGPRGNNVYMLLFHRYLLDRQQRFTPPEMLLRWYSGRECVFRDRPLFWEFRYSGTRWELVRGQVTMVLPLHTADIDPTQETVEDPVGFSFQQRGPAIEFFEGDVDFHFIEDQLETVCQLGGIVDLTDQFSIESIEEAHARLDQLKKISRALLQPTADTIVNHIYMIVSCDGSTFGFIRVLEVFNKDDAPAYDDDNENLVDSALIFDWRFEDDYRLGE